LTLHTRQRYNCLAKFSVCLAKLPFSAALKSFHKTRIYDTARVQPQGGGKDVFVHISAVERAGLSSLNEVQVVQYEVVSNRGKESAENLKVG
jgi:CspA family cold shock protein